VSGSSAIEQRPGFIKLLNKLEQDDVLIVTKLDRLGAIDVATTVASRVQGWHFPQQLAHALVELVPMYLANLEAAHPQQAADCALNLEKRRHDLPPRLQGGADKLRLG
jgi:DNA invertase Pin-like site-specific DNA recombinase